MKDAVARMLENQARFVAGVQLGMELADRGERMEHENVRNRISRPRRANSSDVAQGAHFALLPPVAERRFSKREQD